MSDKDLPVNEENTVSPSGISHGFDTGYAMAYGVDEAIMIRNLQFFITANANRGHNFRDGRFWTYDRLEDFTSHFPYWTIKQIRRILASLVQQEVIIKGEFNSSWSNRTQWYAFKNQETFIKNIRVPKTPLPIDPDLPNRASDSFQNGQLANAEMGNCIYHTSTIPDPIPITKERAAIAGAAKAADEIFPDSLNSKLKTSPQIPKIKHSEDQSNTGLDLNPMQVPEEIQEKPKRTRTPSEFTPKVKELGDKMINALVRNKPNYLIPNNLAPFLTHVDYMLRLDKRDPEVIMEVFGWAIADNFWKAKMYKKNPAEYLRDRFEQLEMSMSSKPAVNPYQVDRRLREKDGTVVDEYKDHLF